MIILVTMAAKAILCSQVLLLNRKKKIFMQIWFHHEPQRMFQDLIWNGTKSNHLKTWSGKKAMHFISKKKVILGSSNNLVKHQNLGY